MSRASKLLEKYEDTFLKCSSCGYIQKSPSGFMPQDGVRIPEVGATRQLSFIGEKCPKCGAMMEVYTTSAQVMGSSTMSPRADTSPGGGLSGGAYH